MAVTITRATLPPGDPRHGTTTGYTYHKCRCDDCRGAWAEWNRDRRAERRQLLVEGIDVPHGDKATYDNWGCRCEDCREGRRQVNEHHAWLRHRCNDTCREVR